MQNTKFIIVEKVGSVFWYEDNVLVSTPLHTDNVFDMSEGSEVDVEATGKDLIDETMTMFDIYDMVKDKLGN